MLSENSLNTFGYVTLKIWLFHTESVRKKNTFSTQPIPAMKL